MNPKRPTQPEPEESKLSITEFATEHRKTLVAVSVVLGLAILGIILYVIQQKQSRSDDWNSLMGTMGLDNHQTDMALAVLGPKLVVSRDQESLESLLEETHSDMVPHVLLRLAISRGLNEDYPKAIEALDRLETEFADHPILGIPSPDRSESLVRATRTWIESEVAWKKTHDFTPPPVNTDRIALVETDKGSFWVGFYPEMASRHVETFVERALAGGFNGTSVTSIERDTVRFGGDVSKDDDPKNDDEREVEGLLPSDKGRYRIPQSKGALSAVAGEGGESPTRFDVVIVDQALGLDKKQTVFGRVLADQAPGFAALEAIGSAVTYGSSEEENIKDNSEYLSILTHPVVPIRILRVSIWKGEKLIEGHTWDTSTVVHPKDAPPIPEEVETPEKDESGGSTDPEKDETGASDPERDETDPDDPEKDGDK